MKSDRIVFRSYGQTVECFRLEEEPGWWCAVQGETEPRGPFKSKSGALEQGIFVTKKSHKIRQRIYKRKGAKR